MIDSVKSVTTNPRREPFIRTGIYSCWFRQSAVKASIEHGDLENLANAFHDDLDTFQLGAIMEWRKGGHTRYCRFHLWCDDSGVVEVPTTVHDTMTYYGDF